MCDIDGCKCSGFQENSWKPESCVDCFHTKIQHRRKRPIPPPREEKPKHSKPASLYNTQPPTPPSKSTQRNALSNNPSPTVPRPQPLKKNMLKPYEALTLHRPAPSASSVSVTSPKDSKPSPGKLTRENTQDGTLDERRRTASIANYAPIQFGYIRPENPPKPTRQQTLDSALKSGAVTMPRIPASQANSTLEPHFPVISSLLTSAPSANALPLSKIESPQPSPPIRKEYNDPSHLVYNLAAFGSLTDLKNLFQQEPTLINSVNTKGQTLIHSAAAGGNFEVIEYLIQHKNASVNATDQEGWTPLHSACVQGNWQVCYLILRHGAQVHLSTVTGALPLHYFVRASTSLSSNLVKQQNDKEKIVLNLSNKMVLFFKIMTWLLALMKEKNVDINYQTEARLETPLHFACSSWPQRSNLDPNSADQDFRQLVLHFLLSNGADASLPDRMGRTPLELLVKLGFQDEVNKLITEYKLDWLQTLLEREKDVTNPLKKSFSAVELLDAKVKNYKAKNSFRHGLASLIKQGQTISEAGRRTSRLLGSAPIEEQNTPAHPRNQEAVRGGVWLGMTKDALTLKKPKKTSQSVIGSTSTASKIETRANTAENGVLGYENQYTRESSVQIARALYELQPTNKTELALVKGGLIRVLDSQTSDEWWYGCTTEGDQGWFPRIYVELLYPSELEELNWESRTDDLQTESESDVSCSRATETIDLLNLLSHLLDSLQVDHNNQQLLTKAKVTLDMAICSAEELGRQAMMYRETKLRGIIKVQALIRMFIYRRRFKNLLRTLKLPKNPTDELLQTERQYVLNLEVLVKKFIEPVQLIIKAGDEWSTMFRSVLVILETNKNLLKSLEEYFQTPLGRRFPNMSLGKIFYDMAPYFNVYSAYVINYDQKEIDNLRKETKALDDLCKKFNAEMKPFTIADYLAKPYQRSLKYPLLLNEIIRNLPEDHVELPDLEKAHEKIKELAKKWNEQRRRAESQQEIMNIQKELNSVQHSINLVEPSRIFIRKGQVIKYTVTKTQPVYLYLFNDILVYAAVEVARKSATSLSVIGKRLRQQYLGMFKLETVHIFNIPSHLMCLERIDFTHAFQIVFKPENSGQSHKSLTIDASSSNDKKDWITDILAQAEVCKTRAESARRGTVTVLHSLGTLTPTHGWDSGSVKEGELSMRSFFSWRPRFVSLRGYTLYIYVIENRKLLGEPLELKSNFQIHLRNSNKGEIRLITNEWEEILFKAPNNQEYRSWVAVFKTALYSLRDTKSHFSSLAES